MIIIGIILSFYFTYNRFREFGISLKHFSDMIAIMIASGYVGAKFIYFLQGPNKYIQDPIKMIENPGQGFVFYGALLFIIPVVVYRLKKWKVDFRESLDIFSFSAVILHAFGRMGCFLNGCCYGKLCNNFLGVSFTNPLSVASPLNTPLYPTQLFDILNNLIILSILFYVEKRKRFSGQLLLTYLILYAVGRSIIENFRGDAERGFVFDILSYSQFIAIIIIGISIIFWNKWKNESLN